MTHIRKIKAGGVNTSWDNFVGEIGTLFYDQTLGNLRLSDGHTPGGIPISVDTTIAAATTSTLGGVKVDGTTIIINSSTGVISAVGGGGGNTGNFIFSNNNLYNLNGGSFNNGDLSHGPTSGLNIATNGSGYSTLYNTYGDVLIQTGSASTITSTWTFDTNGTLYAGKTNLAESYTNALIQIDADVDSYAEFVFQNHNTGTNASTDILLVNNIGDEFNNFIDLGINSSAYFQPTYSVTKPNDGYLFVNGGDLVLGTQSPNKVIKFHAGGTESDNAGMELSQYMLSVNRRVEVTVGTPSPLRFLTKNTSTNVEATSEFRAENDIGRYLVMGVNSSQRVNGNIGSGEAFMYSNADGGTLHIGNKSNINFYANVGLGYTTTATLSIKAAEDEVVLHSHFLPHVDSTFDLGSPLYQWRSLYVSTSTIYINNVPVALDASNNLTINGNSIGGAINVSSTAPATTSTGTLWWDTIDGTMYIRYDDNWVATGPGANYVTENTPVATTTSVIVNELTIDLNYSWVTVTLNNNITSINFINPPLAGVVKSVTVEFVQSGAGHTVVAPGVLTAGGAGFDIAQTDGSRSIVTFITKDGGATYYGFNSGKDWA